MVSKVLNFNVNCINSFVKLELIIFFYTTGASAQAFYTNTDGGKTKFQVSNPMSRNMIGILSHVKKQWNEIVQKQTNETSLNLKTWDDVESDIQAYFSKMEGLMATHGKVIVGFEYEIQGFWDENNLKLATNMLCNKSAICCHKDTDTQYPTILSAFYLDHSNGGELLLPEIAFMCHYRMGDVVIMDGMQWHAVLPMVNIDGKNAKRFSVSFYNNTSSLSESQKQNKKLKK